MRKFLINKGDATIFIPPFVKVILTGSHISGRGIKMESTTDRWAIFIPTEMTRDMASDTFNMKVDFKLGDIYCHKMFIDCRDAVQRIWTRDILIDLDEDDSIQDVIQQYSNSALAR